MRRRRIDEMMRDSWDLACISVAGLRDVVKVQAVRKIELMIEVHCYYASTRRLRQRSWFKE